MKVLLVANSTWNIYNFRQNVINKLIAEGHEVVVVAPVDEYLEYKEKYPNIAHYGIRSLARDSTNPIRDILLTMELTRRYAKLKPDVILHYTTKPNIFGGIAARLNRIPSIAMITGLGYPFIHKGWVNRITSWLYRWTSPFHKKIIFENIADRELFEEKGIIPKGKGVSIKGCGVDISYYLPREAHEKGGTKEMVFTFIGRLLYDKGVVEFVEAARKLRAKYTEVRFWVVGDLDMNNPATIKKEELTRWVNSEIINYHGFQKDIRPFIAQSDCIVLPSYREAIPRTITEGMSMAKPVITTNVAGCREAVDDGSNGYLVEAKNVDSLVAGMEKIIALSALERTEMGKAGRAKVLREFDDRKIAEDIYKVLQQLNLMS